jgi:dihydroorotate dehydrogenase
LDVYRRILRPLAFRLDPETVHELALTGLKRGFFAPPPYESPILEQTFFGKTFKNPLGLAAGFDKNGLILSHWHRYGFGFVEAGTVTFHPQPGNPKPRMFRVPADKGLINRLGFNNEGASALAARLQAAHPQLPLGINLGKSKITELENAPQDYQESFRLLHRFGDYFVLNVSSPNTPGLRSLQEKSALIDIIDAIQQVDTTRPLFVKVAPDLELTALDEVVQVAIDKKLTGLIATNTTISRETLSLDPGQAGGLSGAPLKGKADQILKHLYQACPRTMMLMGVGGIMSADDLYDKIAFGAHLCQVYTGWIYGGPAFVPQACRDFADRLQREGIKHVSDLRGAKV